METQQSKSFPSFLPHNPEAERSVLGSILISNEILSVVLDIGLESRDFYLDAHQKLFEVILFLSERKQAVDLITISAQLKDRGWYDEVGGAPKLLEIFDDCFAAGHAGSYAEIIKDKAVLRRVIQTASTMTSDALKGVPDTEEFLDEIERRVFSISDAKQKTPTSTLREIFLSNLQTIEDMSLKKSDVIGVPTGFRDFDRLTGGLRGGQLMILAARPAMGKTSMFLSMSRNIVIQNPNAVVAIFSLEMSKDELGFRLLSAGTKIPASRLKIGDLTADDWPQLLASSTQMAHAKMHIDDSADLTVVDIKTRCRRIFSKENRLDLVVVDYLQLLKGSKASQRKDGTREQEVSEISRNLKSLSKELKVPVIALSQLNRSLENRANKRPLLADLRESGSIEADADIVAFLYRDEVYNSDTENKGMAELIVAKQRAGATGTVRLNWLSEYTLFTDMEKPKPRNVLVSVGPNDYGNRF